MIDLETMKLENLVKLGPVRVRREQLCLLPPLFLLLSLPSVIITSLDLELLVIRVIGYCLQHLIRYYVLCHIFTYVGDLSG